MALPAGRNIGRGGRVEVAVLETAQFDGYQISCLDAGKGDAILLLPDLGNDDNTYPLDQEYVLEGLAGDAARVLGRLELHEVHARLVECSEAFNLVQRGFIERSWEVTQ